MRFKVPRLYVMEQSFIPIPSPWKRFFWMPSVDFRKEFFTSFFSFGKPNHPPTKIKNMVPIRTRIIHYKQILIKNNWMIPKDVEPLILKIAYAWYMAQKYSRVYFSLFCNVICHYKNINFHPYCTIGPCIYMHIRGSNGCPNGYAQILIGPGNVH